MAGDSSSQAWLTFALTDDSVPKALTLCFSLKRVMTTRKLAVLVSPKVSPALREALHLSFDHLFYHLDLDDQNKAGLKDEEFAKLSALTLKSFEKIVVLEPSVMVIISNFIILFGEKV